MWNILKKELWAYFGNYTVYAILLMFILVSSLFLWFFDNEYNVFNTGLASLNSFFFIAPWLLLLIVPSLTMRQFAEEKQMGTLSWLFTQPVSLKNIILGKFFSVVCVAIVMLISTLFFGVTISHFSLNTIDKGSLFTAYLGLFLLSVLFISVGVMTSTFFSNQVLAYIAAVFLNFLLFFGFKSLASYNLLGGFDYTLQQWGASFHYDGFLKGLIDTRDIIYFIGLPCVFLILSYISLQSLKK